MRSTWIRVAGGCLALAGPWQATEARASSIEFPPPMPGVAVSATSNMDIWEEVLESMRLVCLMLGCTINRSKGSIVSGEVEEQGWTVVLAYAAHGLRADLSPGEKAQGATAAERLLGFLTAEPGLVSDDLRPLLMDTTSSIGQELAP